MFSRNAKIVATTIISKFVLFYLLVASCTFHDCLLNTAKEHNKAPKATESSRRVEICRKTTSNQCLLVLQGGSIAKNLNKILLQIIKKKGLRVQIGSKSFFNISDNFYLLKL